MTKLYQLWSVTTTSDVVFSKKAIKIYVETEVEIDFYNWTKYKMVEFFIAISTCAD